MNNTNHRPGRHSGTQFIITCLEIRFSPSFSYIPANHTFHFYSLHTANLEIMNNEKCICCALKVKPLLADGHIEHAFSRCSGGRLSTTLKGAHF